MMSCEVCGEPVPPASRGRRWCRPPKDCTAIGRARGTRRDGPQYDPDDVATLGEACAKRPAVDVLGPFLCERIDGRVVVRRKEGR